MIFGRERERERERERVVGRRHLASYLCQETQIKNTEKLKAASIAFSTMCYVTSVPT
jgi:hypothetical protein